LSGLKVLSIFVECQVVERHVIENVNSDKMSNNTLPNFEM
jgi:hypothetical protein